MDSNNSKNERLLRIGDVINQCGIHRSSIYSKIKDGTFPRPIKIGPRVSVWVQSEISWWVNQIIIDNNGAAGGHDH